MSNTETLNEKKKLEKKYIQFKSTRIFSALIWIVGSIKKNEVKNLQKYK